MKPLARAAGAAVSLTVLGWAVGLAVPVTPMPQAPQVRRAEDPTTRVQAFMRARGAAGSHWRASRQRDQLVAAARRVASGLGAVRPLAASPTMASWIPLGPMPARFTGTILAGDFSGKVDAIVVDPRNANTVYIGTDSGGVWKSLDGGAHWQPLTDNTALLGIGALALDPSNPDVIYAGTGGDFGFYLEAGILKSTDGGATWINVAAPFLPGSPQFNRIEVDPFDGQNVFAATDYGLWHSTDGGLNWQHVVSQTPSGWVTFDKRNAGVVYYTQDYLQLGDGTNGVYRSTDSGSTWTHIGTTGTHPLPSVNVLAHAKIVIDPSNSSTLYFQTAPPYFGATSNLGIIYRSTDAGANWYPLLALPPGCCEWYTNLFAVSPTNPNVLYAGIYSLYRSMDGGASWTAMDQSTAGGSVSLHQDHHAIAFSADGSVMYEGNDGGVFKTTTPAAATYDWQNLNATLATLMLYQGLSVDPGDASNTMVGTQDNGTLWYQGASTWNGTYICGDGGATAIDPTSPLTVFISCNSRINVYRSTTGGGGGFVEADSGIVSTDRRDDPVPMVMDPNLPNRLYYGTYRVYQTIDEGQNWAPISPDLTLNTSSGSVLSAIAVAPSDSNTVYAASFEGPLHVTTNAGAGSGAIWKALPASIPGPTPGMSSGPILTLAVDPLSADTLYVGVGGSNSQHLLVTTDQGQSWNRLDVGLPDSPINVIVVDRDLPGVIYVGNDVGAYWTADGGQHWQLLGQGLPNVIVTSLVYQASTRTLRAGTFGRSAWDLPLPPLPAAISSSSNALDFGSQLQGGTSAAQTVTLSNARRTAQSLTAISATGDYSQTNNCPASLPVGGTCTISVTFAPQGTGTRGGQLQYGAGGVTESVSLTGTGTKPSTGGSSGGGGALDILTLLAILALVAARRKSPHRAVQ